jgi:hypothetical protein
MPLELAPAADWIPEEVAPADDIRRGSLQATSVKDKATTTIVWPER